MKKCFLSISMLCLLFSGCVSEKKNESSLIELNVSTSYPEKEIKLEEIAEIEYLQLGVYEDFLYYNSNWVIFASSKIIIFNRSDGDILIFSRDGKPISGFNHKGNGPEEYTELLGVIYDEISDEFFITSRNKIAVYSVSGEFKRFIPLLSTYNNYIVNFDTNTLLLYDGSNKYPSPFTFISKEDGNVVDIVDMPKDKEVITYIMHQTLTNNVVTRINVIRRPEYHFVKHNNGYLLTEFSIDTVFYLSEKKELSPILVRKPAIQSMDPVIYMNSFVETSNYEFINAVSVREENMSLPVSYLMRDKKTGSIYRQKITFNDYRGKEITISPETIANTQDSKLGLIVLSLVELQEANQENKLSGRLKELVDNSEEDGNDIYMLLHFK